VPEDITGLEPEVYYLVSRQDIIEAYSEWYRQMGYTSPTVEREATDQSRYFFRYLKSQVLTRSQVLEELRSHASS
jgi:hypothetical protein